LDVVDVFRFAAVVIQFVQRMRIGGAGDATMRCGVPSLSGYKI